MKKLFFFVFVFQCSASFGQFQQGEFAVGGTNTECAHTIVETLYKDYLLYGTTLSFNSPYASYLPYITEIDTSGNLKWAKYMHEQGTSGTAMILVQNKDQQNVILGGTNYNGLCGYGSRNIFVDCLDLSGNVIWSHDIGYSFGQPQLFAFTQVKDSTFAYIGGDGDPMPADIPPVEGWYLNGGWWGAGFGGIDIGVLSINGNLLWGGAIADTSNSFAYLPYGTSAVTLKNNSYLITGGFDSLTQHILLANVDSAKILFAKTMDITGHVNSTGNCIIQTNNGGYAIVGTTEDSVTKSNTDIFILKLDSLYNVKWGKVIGGSGNDSAFSVVQNVDNGYVITGRTNSFGAGGDDVYLLNLDASGNIVWDKAIGGTYSDGGCSVINTDFRGYAIGGYTNSFGLNDSGDFYFVKVDSNGNSCNAQNAGAAESNISVSFRNLSLYYKNGASLCSPHWYYDTGTETVICKPTFVNNTKNISMSVSLYPNPNNGVFIIEQRAQKESGERVEIYNMLDEKVKSEELRTKSTSIDLTNNPAGIYLYRIIDTNGKQVATGKFVIEK